MVVVENVSSPCFSNHIEDKHWSTK